jgi:DNA-binding PadR family transcriptional regulator
MDSAETLTTPDHVVLGMVALGARTGYEIKQTVEASIRFFWTISHAQVYPALERLEGRGLVTGHSEPQGRRPRRRFAITPAGRAALLAWLAGPEEIPFELRDVGMVRLFFSDAQEPEAAAELLARVRERSAQRVAVLRAIETQPLPGAGTERAFPLLTLRMGIAYHEAIIEVISEFEAERRRSAPASPSASAAAAS